MCKKIRYTNIQIYKIQNAPYLFFKKHICIAIIPPKQKCPPIPIPGVSQNSLPGENKYMKRFLKYVFVDFNDFVWFVLPIPIPSVSQSFLPEGGNMENICFGLISYGFYERTMRTGTQITTSCSIRLYGYWYISYLLIRGHRYGASECFVWCMLHFWEIATTCNF